MRARVLAVVFGMLAARAAHGEVPVDVVVRGGGLVPTDRDAWVDTAGSVDVAATWRFGPHVGVEVGGGYERLRTQPENVLGPPEGTVAPVTVTERAWHVDASAVFSLRVRDVEPYALVGAAWYDTGVEEAPSWLESSGGPGGALSSRFQRGLTYGAHAGVGVRGFIRSVIVVADARYQRVTGDLPDWVDAGFDAVRVSFGAGWRF